MNGVHLSQLLGKKTILIFTLKLAAYTVKENKWSQRVTNLIAPQSYLK